MFIFVTLDLYSSFDKNVLHHLVTEKAYPVSMFSANIRLLSRFLFQNVGPIEVQSLIQWVLVYLSFHPPPAPSSNWLLSLYLNKKTAMKKDLDICVFRRLSIEIFAKKGHI